MISLMYIEENTVTRCEPKRWEIFWISSDADKQVTATMVIINDDDNDGSVEATRPISESTLEVIGRGMGEG